MPVKNKRATRKYYEYLCRVAEDMNDTFKAEGSKDRMVVRFSLKDKAYKLYIMKPLEAYPLEGEDL